MATKRMFSVEFITGDSFSEMPVEAQMLYVRLCLASDDYGFCDRPRSVMKSCGASDDSMKLLIAKKFVLSFSKEDRFILLIKHWRIHNYIQKDRRHETKYKELMRELYYDENNAYSLNPGEGHVPVLTEKPFVSDLDTACIQPVSKMDPENRREEYRQVQSSLEQKSIDENNNNSIYLSEERAKRIAELRKSLGTYQRLGYDTQSVYNMAAAEGISREEIESDG